MEEGVIGLGGLYRNPKMLGRKGGEVISIADEDAMLVYQPIFQCLGRSAWRQLGQEIMSICGVNHDV